MAGCKLGQPKIGCIRSRYTYHANAEDSYVYFHGAPVGCRDIVVSSVVGRGVAQY
jgi:hypothetical protein